MQGTGAHNYISITNATAAANVATLNGNTFTNLNVNTTGSIQFFSHAYSMASNATQSFSNNSIVTGYNKGGAGGTVTLNSSNSSSSAGSVDVENSNNFSNITVTGATTIAGWVNTDGGAPAKTVNGNTFNNWTCGTNGVTVLSINFFGTTGSVSNNTVSNITGQGPGNHWSYNRFFQYSGNHINSFR